MLVVICYNLAYYYVRDQGPKSLNSLLSVLASCDEVRTVAAMQTMVIMVLSRGSPNRHVTTSLAALLMVSTVDCVWVVHSCPRMFLKKRSFIKADACVIWHYSWRLCWDKPGPGCFQRHTPRKLWLDATVTLHSVETDETDTIKAHYGHLSWVPTLAQTALITVNLFWV